MARATAAVLTRIRARRAVMTVRQPAGKLARKRLPRQQQPDAIRLEYFKAIRRYLSQARALVEAELVPEFPSLVAEAAAHRGDSARMDARGPGPRVQTIIEGVAHQLASANPTPKLTAMATRYAEATSKHQKTQLGNQLKAAVGVDVFAREPNITPRLEAFAVENVSLITTVSDSYFAEIEARTLAGLRNGARSEDMEAEMVARYDVSESRAKLIARDQIGKLNGELNQVRQENLGISSYVWRCMNDNRVRDRHRERDGNTYSWDDPPGDLSDPGDGGHPGFPINCRCFSEPNIDELLEDL